MSLAVFHPRLEIWDLKLEGRSASIIESLFPEFVKHFRLEFYVVKEMYEVKMRLRVQKGKIIGTPLGVAFAWSMLSSSWNFKSPLSNLG